MSIVAVKEPRRRHGKNRGFTELSPSHQSGESIKLLLCEALILGLQRKVETHAAADDSSRRIGALS